MPRPRSDIAPRILEAARSRFLRQGVDGASLRTIARDAKTSIGMVYYYFPTKDDLFFAVVEQVYVGLLADMARALEPDVAVRDRLRRLYRRVGDMSEIELTTVRLVVREVLVSSSRLERLGERIGRGHVPLVLATLRDGFDDGTLDPSQNPGVVLMATFAIGAVPQLIRRMSGGRLPIADVPSGEHLADALLDVLFAGIARGAARPRARRRARRSAAR